MSKSRSSRALGYGAKNTYNRYCFEESSPVANLFLGIKYMIERDGKDKSSTYFDEVNRFGVASLLVNTAYLPLGFPDGAGAGETGLFPPAAERSSSRTTCSLPPRALTRRSGTSFRARI